MTVATDCPTGEETRTREPSGFRPLRLLRAIRESRHHFVEMMCAIGRTVGDVTAFRAFGKVVILFRDPAAAREVLIHQRCSFRKGMANRWLGRVMGNAFLISEDPSHRRTLEVIRPAFTKKSMDSYVPDMVEIVGARTGDWEDGQEIDVLHQMRRLTLEVIVKAFFRVSLDAPTLDEILRAMLAVKESFDQFYLRAAPGARLVGMLPFSRKSGLEGAVRELDAIVYGWIDERLDSARLGGDLLSRLVAAHRDDPDVFPRRQVRDEVVGLVIGGHETTASSLTWIWYLLGRHPEVEARVHEEVDDVLAGGTPTSADIPRLEYVSRVFDEALRLYPTAYAFGRTATTDCEVDGVSVPEGSAVSLCPILTHRDARHFPDPLRFDPDRWRSGSAGEKVGSAFFPFGLGPRRCIGERFSRLEVAVIVSMLARRWRLRPTSSEPVEEKTSLSLEPRTPPRMTLVPRS